MEVKWYLPPRAVMQIKILKVVISILPKFRVLQVVSNKSILVRLSSMGDIATNYSHSFTYFSSVARDITKSELLSISMNFRDSDLLVHLYQPDRKKVNRINGERMLLKIEFI